MALLQVIVLAVVQGITEFLPISSTAHLILVPWLLGWQDPGLTFNVVLHAGTLVAVLVYFARVWVTLFAGALRSALRPLGLGPASGVAALSSSAPLARERELQLSPYFLWLLVAATVPGAVAGYWLESYAESTFRSPLLIAGTLIGISLVMWLADRRPTLVRGMETLGFKDALLIGAAQAVAILPGTSRAGITISVGLFRNLTREAAARFSFLLATPIIGGATLKKAFDIWEQGLPPGASVVDYAVGFVVSGVVGYAAIAFLLRYLQVRTLKIFVAYRLALGVIILAVELLHSSN
ncbi:MAG: undecaprenyl-diphosphate phosphatase [Candidatus Acidiferrales bacterium]